MANVNKNLQVCGFCSTTGKHGAQFVLCVGESEIRVHKHCGNLLKTQAPADAVVRLVYFAELRREKEAAKRTAEQNRVHAFWAEKFANAKPLRKDRPALLAAE